MSNVIAALGLLFLGIYRTLTGLPISLFGHKPIRIDIPFPGFPVDVVLVSDPNQIQAFKAHTGFARLHEVPSKLLPPWVHLYFSGTRFWDTGHDQWFVPFSGNGSGSGYAERRGAIDSLLAKGFSPADVTKIADLLHAGASDEDLAAAMVPIVNSRFLDGANIPLDVVRDARAVYNSPTDILNPMKGHAKEGAKGVVTFCAAKHPAQGLQAIDVAHNIGAVANPFISALRTLQKNLDADLHATFTQAKNCPTPNVPRVAVEATSFDGLLAYPAVPAKTVFIVSNSKAAGKSGNILYTFGTGVPERSCAFRPFFEAFMGDLQQQLRSGGAQAA